MDTNNMILFLMKFSKIASNLLLLNRSAFISPIINTEWFKFSKNCNNS